MHQNEILRDNVKLKLRGSDERRAYEPKAARHSWAITLEFLRS